MKRRPLDPCPDVDEVLRYNGVEPPDDYADAIARFQAKLDQEARERPLPWDERPAGKFVLRLFAVAIVVLALWATWAAVHAP